jgi:hypothetical protein
VRCRSRICRFRVAFLGSLPVFLGVERWIVSQIQGMLSLSGGARCACGRCAGARCAGGRCAGACSPLVNLRNKAFVPPAELAAVLLLPLLAGLGGGRVRKGSLSWPRRDVTGAERYPGAPAQRQVVRRRWSPPEVTGGKALR